MEIADRAWKAEPGGLLTKMTVMLFFFKFPPPGLFPRYKHVPNVHM